MSSLGLILLLAVSVTSHLFSDISRILRTRRSPISSFGGYPQAASPNGIYVTPQLVPQYGSQLPTYGIGPVARVASPYGMPQFVPQLGHGSQLPYGVGNVGYGQGQATMALIGNGMLRIFK